MSITSKALLAAGAAVLGGCLPGPWDYAPENKPVFQGVTMTAYAVAGRPPQDICFERLHNLKEATTDARAWYDSATVKLEGMFSTGSLLLTLSPRPGPANCFQGPATALFVRGESYTLTARLVWDSAGTQAVSFLTAVARVPVDFSVHDTAYAPAFALEGVGLRDPSDPMGFIPTPYKNGDSVYYLPAKENLAELPHYFGAQGGEDVRAVLITRRFDSTASRPESSFDSIGGFTRSLADFYQPGTMNRLLFYPNTPRPGGRSAIDTMGIFNVLFWTGRNRLYFYGMERIYADYLQAVFEAEENSKVRLPSNVTGGRGFFAGMVVDSFDVNIRLDGYTKAYPYSLTRAASCRERGWFKSRDCIGHYREFCRDTAWSRADCRLDAVYTMLNALDSAAAPAWLPDSARAWALADTSLRPQARRRFCIENNYPAGEKANCAAVRNECENGEGADAKGENACRLILWKRCELAYWDSTALPACGEGLRSFCSSKRDVHKVLCRGIPN